MQIVWFKRDLRIEDNAAFCEAAKHGSILPLYIIEPKLWQQPDMSWRHYMFLTECLVELDQALKQMGHGLVIKVGEAKDVLHQMHKTHQITTIWSHQETWNGWTYERDKQVKQWASKHNVQWHELRQHGVIRRLNDRDGWSRLWYQEMKTPFVNLTHPRDMVSELSDTMPEATKLGLTDDGCTLRQRGGRQEALTCLHSFLYKRGEGYTKEMSSPVTAYDSCSRLSTHLAFGTISIKEVFQACDQRNSEIKEMVRGTKGTWSSAMRSFSGRLRWHCHFIQKLEDEPRIEFENMHPSYDGIRERDFNEYYFQAWKTGRTGYPMVDACMRALIATGWLNFRMRAMLMSFASYHLWLHWRKTALHLAQHFTDYEPGIHYSQVQMQSGTTGINSIRIYNPIKQGTDHDPDGIFIRHWVPELQHLEGDDIHMPWKVPSQLNGYPLPLVDEKTARKSAADKLYAVRKENTHRETAQKIVSKHGSRKNQRSSRKSSKNKRGDHGQGELPL